MLRNSVILRVGSVIEKLLIPSWIPELAIDHCVHGGHTLRLFLVGAQQSTRHGGPT